jgi:hypothetical protein
MDRRNSLYYAAAAGTVLVFIIALVGLTTCGQGDTTGTTPEEQAVVNAYQQGYLEGYSKGYSEGFASGMKSSVAEQTSATVTARRGCAVPLIPPDTSTSDDAAAEE